MTVTNDPESAHRPDDAPTIGPQQFVGWFFEPDNLLGWRMTPGQKAWFVKPGIHTWLSINKDGFRGQEFPAHKGPDDFHILLLADSYGIAIEVEEDETFPSRLQQKLAAYSSERPGKTTLLNASVGGYGTEQEYLYLQAVGQKLNPDIVLVAFHFGSDPIENSLALRNKIHWRFVKLPRPYLVPKDGGGLEMVNYPPKRIDMRQGWNHYYDFLSSKLRKRRLALNNDPLWDQDPVTDQLRRLFSRVREAIYKRWQKYVIRTTVTIDAKIFCTAADEEFEQSWQHTARLMAAVKEETEKLGASLIVSNICTKEQIIPGFMQSRLPAGTKNLADYDPLYPNRRLKAILDDLEIPFIDLIPAFQEGQQAGKILFHEYDLHWNPAGHQLAADIIWQTLMDYLP